MKSLTSCISMAVPDSFSHHSLKNWKRSATVILRQVRVSFMAMFRAPRPKISDPRVPSPSSMLMEAEAKHRQQQEQHHHHQGTRDKSGTAGAEGSHSWYACLRQE